MEAPKNKFYRVVTMQVKQAILGKKNNQPDLEEVLNKLWAQGYLAVHFTDLDGAIMVICEKHIKVPKEDASVTEEDVDGGTMVGMSAKPTELNNPEVITG